MPYRALLWTLASVTLALLLVGLWARAVQPVLKSLPADSAATQAGAGNINNIGQMDHAQHVRELVRGTLLLAFVLVVILLAIGLGATASQWVRRSQKRRAKEKTAYVDAWKLAGERLHKAPPLE